LNPEVFCVQVDVATEYGYYGEEHSVTTPDGYILQIQRIQNRSVRVSEPLLMVHCITCSSAIWMLQEPKNNLGKFRYENYQRFTRMKHDKMPATFVRYYSQQYTHIYSIPSGKVNRG